MLLLEVSLLPVETGDNVPPSGSRSLDMPDRSALADRRLNPMGIVFEGEWDEVMSVVKKCFDELKKDCSRIEFSVKGDWRKGEGRTDQDVDGVA